MRRVERVETAIVGGGPAGAAVACGLAAAGHEAMVLERSVGPHHKVCGEFLSIETQAQLRRLGIELQSLGAVGIKRVAIHSAARGASVTLPFDALSLSRYRLDAALMNRAVACGALVIQGVSVRRASPEGGGWTLRCDNDTTVHCRHLVLATGKWGLRGTKDARDRSLVGFKMHLRLSPEATRALTDRVELALLSRSYAGLELVEDGIANLCFLLPREVVAGLAPGWPALQDLLKSQVPHLASRLEGATPLWDAPLAVVCPTGGHLHNEEEADCYRVGDRLAHIPPFTGDGIAIALESAQLAAEHIRRGLPPVVYLSAALRLTAGPIRFAGLISRLAASGAGQAILMGAAERAPGLISAIVRQTRLPLAASVIR